LVKQSDLSHLDELETESMPRPSTSLTDAAWPETWIEFRLPISLPLISPRFPKMHTHV